MKFNFLVKRKQLSLAHFLFEAFLCAVWSVFFVRSDMKSAIGNDIFYLKKNAFSEAEFLLFWEIKTSLENWKGNTYQRNKKTNTITIHDCPTPPSIMSLKTDGYITTIKCKCMHKLFFNWNIILLSKCFRYYLYKIIAFNLWHVFDFFWEFYLHKHHFRLH